MTLPSAPARGARPPAAPPQPAAVDHPRTPPAPAGRRHGLTRAPNGVFRSALAGPASGPESNGSSCEVVPQSPRKGAQYAANALTEAEVDALIAQCSPTARTGIRDRALLILLNRSGLRIEEALALRTADLNIREHSMRLLDTKSKKPQTRGYHPSADDALARWLEIRKTLPRGAGTLFCTLNGGRIWAQQIRNKLHRLGAAAGIGKRVHPHGLRHSFAVKLRRQGTDIAVISALLGHSSIVHTERYLKGLTNDQAIAALQQVRWDT